jgi:hypothetical protein
VVEAAPREDAHGGVEDQPALVDRRRLGRHQARTSSGQL